MGKNYTAHDAANTAVRAFLYCTSQNKKYEAYFLTEPDWKEICNSFDNKCTYCRKKIKSLQREHLRECNRIYGGLHLCGNVIPSCGSCNQKKNKLAFKDKVELIKQKGLYEEFKKHQMKYIYPVSIPQEKIITDDSKLLYSKVQALVSSSLK